MQNNYKKHLLIVQWTLAYLNSLGPMCAQIIGASLSEPHTSESLQKRTFDSVTESCKSFRI